MSETILFNRLKSEFLSWYETQKELSYYFTAKDAGSLKQLISKIKWVGKEKHKEDGNEWILDAFKWILGHLDEWTKKNVSLALINSRFNEILSNGKKITKPQEQFAANYTAFKRTGDITGRAAN